MGTIKETMKALLLDEQPSEVSIRWHEYVTHADGEKVRWLCGGHVPLSDPRHANRPWVLREPRLKMARDEQGLAPEGMLSRFYRWVTEPA